MEKNKLILSRSELTDLIHNFHYQVRIIKLCLDELDALKEIGNDRIKMLKANNFFYIAHTSIIFRYEVELSKLFDGKKEGSINWICNRIKDHKEYFRCPDEVITKCKDLKKDIKKYKTTLGNINNRRNKTLAHNDIDYYYFSQKAIDEFPFDYDEVQELATLLLGFSIYLYTEIGSDKKGLGYVTNPYDVKRLFEKDNENDIEKVKKIIGWDN